MIDSEFFAKLRCPESHQPLRVATTDELARVNNAINGGGVKNRAGKAVVDAIDGGLVCDSRAVLYPIRNNIPILLAEEALPLAKPH